MSFFDTIMWYEAVDLFKMFLSKNMETSQCSAIVPKSKLGSYITNEVNEKKSKYVHHIDLEDGTCLVIMKKN